MFDQLPASTLVDRLSDAVYRWSGIAQWPETEATVLGCEWVTDDEDGCGWFNVTFIYRAKGTMQTGSFPKVNVSKNAPPYSCMDTLTLRYNPKDPSRFYYPNERSQFWGIKAVMFSLLAGLVLAAISIAAF